VAKGKPSGQGSSRSESGGELFFSQTREITILPLCLFPPNPLLFFIIFFFLPASREQRRQAAAWEGAGRQELSVRRGRRVHGTESLGHHLYEAFRPALLLFLSAMTLL